MNIAGFGYGFGGKGKLSKAGEYSPNFGLSGARIIPGMSSSDSVRQARWMKSHGASTDEVNKYLTK